MDASKILNVLKDISNEEIDFSIDTKLNELFIFIQQNNIEQSEIKKDEIYKIFNDSIVNEYTKSNLNVIKKIKGDNFIGYGARNFLESLFSSENFKLISRLEEYKKERSNFIQNINALIKSLEDFGFEPHYQEEFYEVGLTLPDDYSELDKLHKALNEYDKFLKNISEISGDKRENKVILLSSGSSSFFVLVSAMTAKTLDIVLNKIADLYLKIQQIQRNCEELKFLKNKTIESELINEEKKIYNSFLENILSETLKTYKGENGRKNELQVELKNNLKRILKLTEYGANIEIISPELFEPEQLNENENDKEKIKEYEKIKEDYQSKLQDNKKFQITNKKILQIKANKCTPLLSAGLLSDNENNFGINDNGDGDAII